MTLLLASVTGPDEAALMLTHGADIIDLKDPSNGALGALAPDVVRATVAAIHGRPAYREVDRRLVYIDPHPPPLAFELAKRMKATLAILAMS